MNLNKERIRSISALFLTFFIFIFLGFNTLAEEEPGEVELPVLIPGDIIGCGSINQSGTYTLTNDVSVNGFGEDILATCFEISASDVILDGGEYTIRSMDKTGEAIVAHGTEKSLNNITVKKFIIENWDLGIKYNSITTGNIELNSMTQCAEAGIILMRSQDIIVVDNDLIENQGRGITISSAQNIILENNIVGENEGDAGIKIMNSKYNTLLYNTIYGHTNEKALHITGRSDHNTITGNIFENNYEYNAFGIITGPEFALKIGGESPENFLSDNIVRNNIGGVSVDPANTVFNSNEVYDNLGTGVELGGDNIVISENDIHHNYGDGLSVSGEDIEIETNSIYGNFMHGLVLYGTSENEIRNNILYGNAIADFTSVLGSHNAVEELNIGENIISFNGNDLLLNESPLLTELPNGFTDLGIFIVIENNSYNSEILLKMYYDDKKLNHLEEENLRIWRFDEGIWYLPIEGENSVDTKENYVQVKASEFGIFAILLGNDTTPPVADAGENVTVNFGETITFNASNSYDDLGIKSYYWDFGDGEISSDMIMNHTYDSPGIYLATLLVEDYYENSDEDDITITVLIDEFANCTDIDGDGFYIEGGECGIIDCDDSNASINPLEEDIANDGIDQDCSGEDKEDNDGDGIENFEDFILGSAENITSNLNCSLELKINDESNPTYFFGEAKVELLDCQKNTVIEFNNYFDENNTLNLFNMSLMIDEVEDRGSLCVQGINLESQNLTKTIYINKITDISSICIKDSSVGSVSEISQNCDAVDETMLICPGEDIEKGYNCTFKDETNSTYKIEGLHHSAIIQQGYCGDGIIQEGEACDGGSSCTSSCTLLQTSSGGSSGSSSNVCSADYSCGDWEPCLETNTRVRECIDLSNCGFATKIETENCIFEELQKETTTKTITEITELSQTSEDAYLTPGEEENEITPSLITGEVINVDEIKTDGSLVLPILALALLIGLFFYFRRKKE